jgi:hypothetical protein
MMLVQPRTSQLLATAARVAEQQPSLMASALAGYRTRTGLAEERLAAQLGCQLMALHGLALCRRPAPTFPDFATQVTALSMYVDCDPLALQALLLDETRVTSARPGWTGMPLTHPPAGPPREIPFRPQPLGAGSWSGPGPIRQPPVSSLVV